MERPRRSSHETTKDKWSQEAHLKKGARRADSGSDSESGKPKRKRGSKADSPEDGISFDGRCLNCNGLQTKSCPNGMCRSCCEMLGGNSGVTRARRKPAPSADISYISCGIHSAESHSDVENPLSVQASQSEDEGPDSDEDSPHTAANHTPTAVTAVADPVPPKTTPTSKRSARLAKANKASQAAKAARLAKQAQAQAHVLNPGFEEKREPDDEDFQSALSPTSPLTSPSPVTSPVTSPTSLAAPLASTISALVSSHVRPRRTIKPPSYKALDSGEDQPSMASRVLARPRPRREESSFGSEEDSDPESEEQNDAVRESVKISRVDALSRIAKDGDVSTGGSTREQNGKRSTIRQNGTSASTVPPALNVKFEGSAISQTKARRKRSATETTSNETMPAVPALTAVPTPAPVSAPETSPPSAPTVSTVVPPIAPPLVVSMSPSALVSSVSPPFNGKVPRKRRTRKPTKSTVLEPDVVSTTTDALPPPMLVPDANEVDALDAESKDASVTGSSKFLGVDFELFNSFETSSSSALLPDGFDSDRDVFSPALQLSSTLSSSENSSSTSLPASSSADNEIIQSMDDTSDNLPQGELEIPKEAETDAQGREFSSQIWPSDPPESPSLLPVPSAGSSLPPSPQLPGLQGTQPAPLPLLLLNDPADSAPLDPLAPSPVSKTSNRDPMADALRGEVGSFMMNVATESEESASPPKMQKKQRPIAFQRNKPVELPVHKAPSASPVSVSPLSPTSTAFPAPSLSSLSASLSSRKRKPKPKFILPVTSSGAVLVRKSNRMRKRKSMEMVGEEEFLPPSHEPSRRIPSVFSGGVRLGDKPQHSHGLRSTTRTERDRDKPLPYPIEMPLRPLVPLSALPDLSPFRTDLPHLMNDAVLATTGAINTASDLQLAAAEPLAVLPNPVAQTEPDFEAIDYEEDEDLEEEELIRPIHMAIAVPVAGIRATDAIPINQVESQSSLPPAANATELIHKTPPPVSPTDPSHVSEPAIVVVDFGYRAKGPDNPDDAGSSDRSDSDSRSLLAATVLPKLPLSKPFSPIAPQRPDSRAGLSGSPASTPTEEYTLTSTASQQQRRARGRPVKNKPPQRDRPSKPVKPSPSQDSKPPAPPQLPPSATAARSTPSPKTSTPSVSPKESKSDVGRVPAKPEAVKPEAVKPEAVKPEAAKPDAAKPEAFVVPRFPVREAKVEPKEARARNAHSTKRRDSTEDLSASPSLGDDQKKQSPSAEEDSDSSSSNPPAKRDVKSSSLETLQSSSKRKALRGVSPPKSRSQRSRKKPKKFADDDETQRETPPESDEDEGDAMETEEQDSADESDEVASSANPQTASGPRRSGRKIRSSRKYRSDSPVPMGTMRKDRTQRLKRRETTKEAGDDDLEADDDDTIEDFSPIRVTGEPERDASGSPALPDPIEHPHALPASFQSIDGFASHAGYQVETKRGKSPVLSPKKQEDRFVKTVFRNSAGDDVWVYVVADGHAGAGASSWFSEALRQRLQPFISSSSFSLNSAEGRKRCKETIIEFYVDMDRQYCERRHREFRDANSTETSSDISDEGTTLLLVVLAPGWLITANVGDCRAVLLHRAADAKWGVKFYTTDHSLSDSSQARNVKQHKDAIVSQQRVKLRSTDDLQMLYPKLRLAHDLNLSKSMGDTIFKGDDAIVSNVPDVEFLPLSARDADSTVLVIGSDGVWDYVVATDAKRSIRTRDRGLAFVAQHVGALHDANVTPDGAAQWLWEHVDRGTHNESRGIRDDFTAAVVYLKTPTFSLSSLKDCPFRCDHCRMNHLQGPQ